LISPMKNSAGGVTGWLASVSDITHLKAVERQALKRLHHLEQIYELSEIVNRAEVIEQIYETALDVLMQTVGSNRSAIFLSDAAGQMQFKAWRGFSDEFRRDMARYTPWKSGTADPQPFFLPDVASESFDPEMNSVLQREGVGGLAWIPLVYQKRLLGQFILAYNVAHDFRDEERHLIQTIAAQLAFAIARKQSEEALRESERWLRLIAENTTDVIFAFDMQRRLLYANPALVQLTGYSAAEIRERRFINWIHPEDQERMLNLWDLLYQGKGYEGEEFRLITKQGKMKWSLSSWGPLYDESGHQIGVQGRERDITERKMAEEALQKARQKLREYAEELERRVAQRTAALQESNEQMEAFCYSVSHDLRAPLRAMQGFTRALVEDYQGVLDEVGRDYAQRVATAAQRMDRLIQDLLEYSRLGRMDLEVTACAVRPLLDTALAQLASEIREKQATVTLVEPLRAVLANKTLLEQVFVNLISNALKFVAPGTAPQVRIWSEETESSIRLFIQDNGIGIDPMHQERIFRVFERLHGFDAYPGTGIGLAIVRKGIERMGGQVGLTSQPSQGSCFWIALAKANLPATD
jgi:PAS domain S-box-containing protein